HLTHLFFRSPYPFFSFSASFFPSFFHLHFFLSFFFNDTATTEIYTLSLHDALPISRTIGRHRRRSAYPTGWVRPNTRPAGARSRDRKSTRLNSSHQIISYAVFCLKKKKKKKKKHNKKKI